MLLHVSMAMFALVAQIKRMVDQAKTDSFGWIIF